MTVRQIAEQLGLEVLAGNSGLDVEVTGGYASDLLSDVMGFAREGELWITLQSHRNITGIASLKDLAGIIIVKGFVPDKDAVAIANNEGIPILGCKIEAFEITGMLYDLLKAPK